MLPQSLLVGHSINHHYYFWIGLFKQNCYFWKDIYEVLDLLAMCMLKLWCPYYISMGQFPDWHRSFEYYSPFVLRVCDFRVTHLTSGLNMLHKIWGWLCWSKLETSSNLMQKVAVKVVLKHIGLSNQAFSIFSGLTILFGGTILKPVLSFIEWLQYLSSHYTQNFF